MSVCLSLYMSISLSLSLSLYIYIYIYIYIYVCSSTSLFGDYKSATHNFVLRMRPQATGSNLLSVSIICPSVRPSGRPLAFCNFGICIQ